jgi:subtilisin
MLMSAIIDRDLQNFGYARVLIVSKKKTARASSALPSTKIEENFMNSIPEGARTSYQKESEEPYRFFPYLGVYIGYTDKKGIKKMEDTAATIYGAEYISPIRPVAKRLAMSAGNFTWGLERLGIDELLSQGINGKGVAVGMLDTGVDPLHESLRGKIEDFIETDLSGDIVPDPRSPEEKGYDSDDHGTHCAGTICGGMANGMAIGVAPGCNLYVGMVIEGGDVLLRVLTGMEWCLEKKVRVLSMSLGIRGYTPFWLDITRRLRESGTLPIFAIGNEGPGFSRSPGNYPESVSVGAVDSNDHMATFSSSIKFNRPIEPYQPDCVAPGVNVISAKPSGGVQAMDGTSMATPHVAGVAALLFGAYPTATIEKVEKAMLDTCDKLSGENKERYGYGLISPVKALKALKKMV